MHNKFIFHEWMQWRIQGEGPGGPIRIESDKLAIFSRSRGGVNKKKKHFYTVFGLQLIILEWNNTFWNYMQT